MHGISFGILNIWYGLWYGIWYLKKYGIWFCRVLYSVFYGVCLHVCYVMLCYVMYASFLSAIVGSCGRFGLKARGQCCLAAIVCHAAVAKSLARCPTTLNAQRKCPSTFCKRLCLLFSTSCGWDGPASRPWASTADSSIPAGPAPAACPWRSFSASSTQLDCKRDSS